MRHLALTLSLFALLTTGGIASASGAPQRVATVDLAGVVEALPAGKAAKEELAKRAKERSADYARQRQELEAAIHIAKHGAGDEAAKAKKIDELTRKRQALTAQAHGLGQALRQQEQELLAPLVKRIEGVIAEVAREQGVAFVLRRPYIGLLYRSPEADIIDLTPLVAAKMKEKRP